MNIYVGNVSYGVTEKNLEDLFSEFGEVASARIIMDRETGRSKGFGFVEMPTKEEALEAIKNLDGKEVDGRNLRVNEARAREDNFRRKPRY